MSASICASPGSRCSGTRIEINRALQLRARRADFTGSAEPRVGIGWSRHPSHRTESVDRGMFNSQIHIDAPCVRLGDARSNCSSSMRGRIEPPSPSYTVTGPVPDLATPIVNPRPGTPTTERVALGGFCRECCCRYISTVAPVFPPSAARPRATVDFLAAAQCSAERSERRALCMGLHFIKRKKWRAHRASMLSAFGFSSLFLISGEPLAITRQSGCIEKRPARLVKRRPTPGPHGSVE